MKDLIERLLEEEIDAAAQAVADEVDAAEEEAEEATDDEPAAEAGEEEVTDGLKESISGLLRDLNVMGLPINEGEVAISLYRHLENIVESAKLVGVSEISVLELGLGVAISAAIVRSVLHSSNRALISCNIKKNVYDRNKCRIAVYNAAINQLKNGKNKCQKLKDNPKKQTRCQAHINKEIKKLMRLRDKHITENKTLKVAENQK
jgi:hypothetical protein